ncbi:hypothetical protein AZZ68_002651 [Klebsiella pneumoniae]|nr:hypothetical protein AZZ68_002651 [Klebsiella pneumoniae]
MLNIVPVYPRWRGEHSVHALLDPAAYGLSPLARGTPSGNVPGSTGRRFIPAGAGNTRSPHARHFIRAVYPRWRGEHLLHPPGVRGAVGLSPLARGTRRINSQVQRPPRFIPAGAGNTFISIPIKSKPSVYPRWRGEHRAKGKKMRELIGLSPLARGTRLRGSDTRRKAPVYPRWRGEHHYHPHFGIKRCGLSPLARGTLWYLC